jgi:eukaryotic-like serine/threonine-protein kinase
MSELQPSNTDAILGGQSPPPVDAAVLGGTMGRNRRLAHEFGWSYELVEELSKTHDVFSFETVTVDDCGEIITSTKKHAFYYTENLGNDITLDMVYIPSGSFMMGSDDNINEQPIHEVTLKSFYISRYPITQPQYQAIMHENLSEFRGKDLPVDRVALHCAGAFCARLSNITQKKYCLPSENQWEYACRANSTTRFSFGNKITDDVANFNSDLAYDYARKGLYRSQITKVGTFPPNAFGLGDMHGNVWEWCFDNWHENYQYAPSNDIAWRHNGLGNSAVLRGGSWYEGGRCCTSSYRSRYSAGPEHKSYGIRVVRLP